MNSSLTTLTSILVIWSGVFIKTVTAVCTCTGADVKEKSCTCTGENVKNISQVIGHIVCANGSPYRLVLKNLPNLVQISNGFELPITNECRLWNQLTVLEISQTAIHNFSLKSFKGLPVLQHLDISNNSQIVSYREDTFKPIGKTLVKLVATDNLVHSLTKRVFSGLKIIRKLKLSRNKIGYIDPDVFSTNCCSQLTELFLDHNILTDLEENTFTGLISLKILDLRGNPLLRLPIQLFRPFSKTLTHLWMSHEDTANFGGFSNIPETVFLNMSQLKVLAIVHLKLKNISSNSFAGLTGLKELNLSGNRLTVISNGTFSNLPNLENLDLSFNGLVCLPDCSNEKYFKLRKLDLSWNGLAHLTPKSFFNIASSTPTQRFPKFVLNISSNPIQRIEPNTFCFLGGPVELIVGFPNKITRNHESKGFWNTLSNWPNSPFALIGNQSVIRGMQHGPSKHENVSITSDGLVQGRDDADHACFSTDENNPIISKILDSALYKNVKYSQQDVNTSLNSGCPWLPSPTLLEWQLSKLGIRGLSGTPNNMVDGNLGNALEQTSRIYLLVIVAICVAFLLAALTVIMCYRTWSRRTTQKFDINCFDIDHPINDQITSNNANQPVKKHGLLENNNVHLINGRGLAALGTLPETPEPCAVKDTLQTTPNNLVYEQSAPTNINENSLISINSEALKDASDGLKPPCQFLRSNSEPKAEECEHMKAFGVL